MRDGIDGVAFRAELRSLDPEVRRRLRREFTRWLREAARPEAHRTPLALLIVASGAAAALVCVLAHSPPRPLMAIAGALLAIGCTLNMRSAGRAREWRRLHPLDRWRRSDR